MRGAFTSILALMIPAFRRWRRGIRSSRFFYILNLRAVGATWDPASKLQVFEAGLISATRKLTGKFYGSWRVLIKQAVGSSVVRLQMRPPGFQACVL